MHNSKSMAKKCIKCNEQESETVLFKYKSNICIKCNYEIIKEWRKKNVDAINKHQRTARAKEQKVCKTCGVKKNKNDFKGANRICNKCKETDFCVTIESKLIAEKVKKINESKARIKPIVEKRTYYKTYTDITERRNKNVSSDWNKKLKEIKRKIAERYAV